MQSVRRHGAILFLIAAILSTSGARRALAETAGTLPALTDAEQDQFLKTAKILTTRQASKGITGSTRVSMTDGNITHDAHVQCIDESKPEFKTDRGTELNFRDSYKFNIAAYRLARLLGIENLPVTVERKVGGKSCAVDWWVDYVMTDEGGRKKKNMEPPDLEAWNEQMYVVRVFDQLIFNVDRNLTNLLILKNWDIVMIDHSRSFRLSHKLQEARNLEKCDRTLLHNLRALTKDDVAKALMPYCTRAELDAVMARRDAIVRYFDDRITQRGETAVLYDLRRIKEHSSNAGQ
jgi:hypothetical protein